MLLEIKEQGECEHEEGDTEEHDSMGTYHVASGCCKKCGKSMLDWAHPTKPVEKIDLTDSTIYNGYNPLVEKMPEITDRYTCMALAEIQDKFNVMVKAANKIINHLEERK